MQSDHYGSPSPVLSAAGAAGALARPVRAKGPRVWLDMDQQELDDAYDQLVYAPNRDQVGKRRIANSERARAILGPPQRIAYGPSEIERLDVYRTPRANAPVNIFVHGGAWRANKAADYAFLAEPFVNAGAHYVVLDFTNVDDAAGSLFPMVEQVRDTLKGAMLGSGMYDLHPVRLSKRSRYVKFTDEMEQALSAVRHLDKLHTPLILAYGTCETPEFQRQTRDLFAAVRAAGKPAEMLVGEGYNHFEMLETLANPYGLLGRAVLAQMGLTK